MYKVVIGVVALMSIAVAAGAQPRALADRVEEELLSEGISLVRLGQRLELKPRDSALEVSLVDRTTDRMVATRVVERLPAEQAAAIAQLTVVVADMLRERGLVATPRTTDWDSTFKSDSVIAYHRPSSLAVIAIAKPGRTGEETRRAAAALVNAYRTAGVTEVQDRSTVADVSSEDGDIVTRAAALAVDEIAIVRVFIDGPSVRAVVTLYRKDHQLVASFSAVAGEPLPAHSQTLQGAAVPLQKDGVVRLWIRSESRRLQMLRTATLAAPAGTSTLQLSNVICISPCGEIVDGSRGETFTFGEEGQAETSAIQLLGYQGDVTATVKPLNRGLFWGGLSLASVGVTTLILGLGFVALADGDEAHVQQDRRLGLYVSLSGVVATIPGILMMVAGRSQIDLAPGRPR
jgi:hypothetical protein